MKVLIASDKFKGSLSAVEAAEAISSGIKRVLPSCKIMTTPLADGGEGTVDAVIRAVNGKKINCKVLDPLGREFRTYFGLYYDTRAEPPKKIKTALIEMAKASGFLLLREEERNPMHTTTYGTGQLIRKALLMGCRKIILGVGGTSTCDGGMGALQALGIEFYDSKGDKLGFGGKELSRLSKIETKGLIKEAKDAEFIIATDVFNRLYGKKGAAFVYAPQKGASSEEVKILDKGLRKLAEVIFEKTGKDVSRLEGTGAAGGIGAGLKSFLRTEIVLGIDFLLEMIGLREKMKDKDLVITGEGKFDEQTLFGKAPIGVAEMAKQNRVPVYLIAGSITVSKKQLKNHGIVDSIALLDYAKDLEESMKDASRLVEKTAEILIRKNLK